MTLLYYDPIFLEHKTGRHPESPERILPVVRHLHFVALDTLCVRPSWSACTPDELARVHSPEYLASLKAYCSRGGGYIEQDTVVSRRSYDAAVKASGAVCDAVRRVLAGEHPRAFCLVRPPGHHALQDWAMGFCLVNNIAVAAHCAIDQLGIERVLIVDWDVHHGNGTQATFWEDGRVGYFSIHRWPFYPGTGAADETGAGAGLGATCNVPVTFGTARSVYLARFAAELDRFAAHVRPQLVLISAGFDSHHSDPIGSLGLESEDFTTITRTVLAVADTYANGRVVSALEGGYNPTALTECVELHLEELLEHDQRQSTE